MCVVTTPEKATNSADPLVRVGLVGSAGVAPTSWHWPRACDEAASSVIRPVPEASVDLLTHECRQASQARANAHDVGRDTG